MSSEKYIGLDVHQATISVAVMDSQGKVIMESILETKASTILEFLAGLRGSLFVTFEEGTWAAWLYDLLKPHVTEVLVCNPRKIPLLKHGNKSDKIDARKLAERLRLHDLKPVYHGETGIRMLRELARSYLTVVKDLSRVMNRLKALYRSWAIPCAGRDVYYTRHRSQWLEKIPEAGTRRRAEQLYQQLDQLRHLRQQARRELLAESRKHAITAKLRQIPSLGPIRSALAVALIQTPYRYDGHVTTLNIEQGTIRSELWLQHLLFRDTFRMEKSSNNVIDDAPYSWFWYSLELFLPVVDLGMAKNWCRFRNKTGLRTYARIHQLAGWILVPVSLAALTGAIE